MAASSSGKTTPSTRADTGSAPLTARPVEVTSIVVPLDGSPFAERALAVADWVGARLDAGVHPVEVVGDDEEAEGAIRYLDSVTRRHHGSRWDVFQRDDVARILADLVASSPGRMACMATHGGERSGAPVGSTASAVVAGSDRPVILVGPEARVVPTGDGPVVVAVDGSRQDDSLVAVALGWAAELGCPVEIVTVAEPGGPAEPGSYVASLAARAADASPGLLSTVVYGPVGLRDGLVPLLAERTAALVVLGSRHRRGGPGPGLGDDATRLVHDAPAPAVVVPPPQPTS
jgi:nucleotide-binding universal stress UspA family protein